MTQTLHCARCSFSQPSPLLSWLLSTQTEGRIMIIILVDLVDLNHVDIVVILRYCSMTLEGSVF